MTAQVYQSTKQKGVAQYGDKIGMVAGGIIGAYGSGGAGTAAGAATGAAKGGAIGGMVGNLFGQKSGPTQNVQSSAMERRMGAGGGGMQPVDNPQQALEDARMALAQQSPEVQAQYEAPIKAALLQSRRNQGVV